MFPDEICIGKNPLTTHDLVANAMSSNRFRFIMQNLHCSDNANLDIQDKFSKVRPLIDAMNQRFIDLAPQEEYHSLDESMVPYYGRHGAKQFIRGKPIRWGYKFWMGTTTLGYVERFDPYQGSSTTIPDKYKQLGLGASIVLLFVDTLENKAPTIFISTIFLPPYNFWKN